MKIIRTLGPSGDSQRSNQAFSEQAARALGNFVSFGWTTSNTDQSRNIDCWMAVNVAVAVVANTDFAVPHNLQRVPIGYLIMGKSAPGDIYTGAGAWTAATNAALGNIFLRCSNTGLTINVIII